MRNMASFYRLLFYFLIIVIVGVSCENDEESAELKVLGNDKGKIWEANPVGDTITIDFTTNISPEELMVNNPLEWIESSLQDNKLVLYVGPNGGITPRTGSLSFLSVRKGVLLVNNVLKISQSSKRNMAKVKHIYTHFPKMKYDDSQESAQNRVLKMLVPTGGGETEYQNIFDSSISKKDLVIETKYSTEDTKKWIDNIELVEGKYGVTGIKITTSKLPENINQRNVQITLRDKDVDNISASIICSQLRELVQLADKKDFVTIIPMQPSNFAIPLKTKLSADQLHLHFYDYGIGKYPPLTHEEFDAQIEDPIFLHNYIEDKATENVLLNAHYGFTKTTDGVILKGLTSTNSNFKSLNRLPDFDYKKMIVITNDVNEQKLLLLVEEEDLLASYIFFKDGTKEQKVSIPGEGGSLSPHFRTNRKAVYIIGPSWANWEKNKWSWNVNTQTVYPDITELKDGGITIKPNTLREPRVGTIIIKNNSLQTPDATTTEASPIKIKIRQEGFEGNYLFKLLTEHEDPIMLSREGANKSFAFETNLSKEQVQISKTANAGWISYTISSDDKSGYVTSLQFSAEANKTGTERSVTFTISGVANEGLQDVKINFTQSN